MRDTSLCAPAVQVIDTQRYTVRLYTSSGGVKMIRRHTGAIERQYRLNIGKLPVAYRCKHCADSLLAARRPVCGCNGHETESSQSAKA